MNKDSPLSNQVSHIRQLTFSRATWANLHDALDTYAFNEAQWQAATDSGDWDRAASWEEDMQSVADVVLDIMLHVRTQQFPEGVT